MSAPERKSPPRLHTGNGPEKITGERSTANYSASPANLLLPKLERVRETAPGQWIASCPGPLHKSGDRCPSLSIKQTDDRLLLFCHAGCANDEIVAALGLRLADLFDRPLDHHRKPLSTYQRRRYGQAVEALKALAHECRIVYVLAEQVHAGFALDPAERDRLKLAMTRVSNAEGLAA